MYLVPSEIFPMVIRSFGMSFSIMGQFIATTILLEAAPTAFQTIGYKFWIILIILTLIYGILVYLFLPEVSAKHPWGSLNHAKRIADERHDTGGH